MQQQDGSGGASMASVGGSAGGGGGSGAVGGGAAMSSLSGGTKVQSSKNGNIFTDGMKDSVIIAATKQLTKKDKRGSNAALQAASIDTSDTSYLDKSSSPSLQVKRKSSSIDVTSNGPNIDLVQLSSFANGNPIITEEGGGTGGGVNAGKPSPTSANGDYTGVDGPDTDLSSSMIHGDPTTTHSNSNNTGNKPASTANNNMQISQV